MPCNTYLEWLDTPASESGSLPEYIARHLSACRDCRQAHAEIQALRTHCARMSPDSNEALRLWESLAPLIPAQPAAPSGQPAGTVQPAGSASTVVKASAAISTPVGIGPVVILAAAAILIGVIEYGLSTVRLQPSSQPKDQISRTVTSGPPDVSSAPSVLQRHVPAKPASGSLPATGNPRPESVSASPALPVSDPERTVRPPEPSIEPESPAAPLTAPPAGSSSTSGDGDVLTDGFVPMTAPSGGRD